MTAFSMLEAWANAQLIRTSFFLIGEFEKMRATPVLTLISLIAPGPLAGVAPKCSGPLVDEIKGGAVNIISFLIGVGIFLTVIGIIIGGLMRATAFGNERRIASSNTAITGSIIGIVIVVLAVAAGQTIPAWFVAGNTCTITSPPPAP